MKKLIIQIPCWNEEATLPVTLAALPTQVEGFAAVEVLVVDDGSDDATAAVAKAHGAHLVSHLYHRGLASAYMTGLTEALRLGADVIVNIDADNQYNAQDIPLLAGPVARGEALVVIGERPLRDVAHFSWTKKRIHGLGNLLIRWISGLEVRDATSGFRAVHSGIARQIMIYSSYTYTIEMLVLLGSGRIPVHFVPVRVNPQNLRPSRLIKSNLQYLRKSAAILLRSFFMYRPMMMCLCIAGGLGIVAALCGLYYHTHPRSLGVLALACICGAGMVVSMLSAFICDGIRASRVLLEQARSARLAVTHDDA